MEISDQIAELLLQWEDANNRGDFLTPQQLCENCPELLDDVTHRIQELQSLERKLSLQEGTLEAWKGGAAPADDTTDTVKSGENGGAVATSALPQLPGYEILGLLGRAGMGIVYKARQLVPERIVALKMIRAGELADAEDLARFLNEVEAAARLRHPHIIQVYEVGNYQGRPYFTMEYMEGGSLADVLRAGPLTAREAAGLVEPLARAVQAAHEQGIVHRDLKPGNILLPGPASAEARTEPATSPSRSRDRQWDAKIADFGLAKRLEGGPGVTRTSAILGTPSYMAPEQAAGKGKEVGPAADIYALGAVLYECLCGRPPFKAATPYDTVMQVLSEEPATPRLLQPKLPRDLETICLKCLEKEPSKRYASALELAEELARFRAGEPIRARPIRSWERAAKWGKRRPAVAALVVLSSFTVLALVVGGFAFARHEAARAAEAATRAAEAAEQKARAEAGQVEAERQRQRADRNLMRARKAVDDYCSSVAEDPRLKQQDLHLLRKKLLETAVPFYQEFAAQKAEDPALTAGQGHALLGLGLLRAELGDKEQAAHDTGLAAELFAALAAREGGMPAYRLELARAYRARGSALAALSRRPEAEQIYRQAIAVSGQLVAEYPADPERQQELAADYNNLGILLYDLGRNEEAIEVYKQALATRERLAAEHPAVAEYRRDLAGSQMNVGANLQVLGRRADAEQAYQKARELFEGLVAAYPAVPDHRRDLAKVELNLGQLLAERGGLDAAESVGRKAVELLERLAGDYPAVTEYRQQLGLSLINWANSLRALGRKDDAARAYQRSHDLYARLAADYPAVSTYTVNLALACGNYGHVCRDRGRALESLTWYDEALARLAPVFAKPKALAFAGACQRDSLAGKALSLVRLGRSADAAAIARPLAANKQLNDEALYNTACALAGCSAAEGSNSSQQESDAALAVSLLRRAQAADYFADASTRDDLKEKDADLASLRRRDDFKRLVADLDGKPKGK
jgi:tetratricopeptide (TPR) repeat protein